MGMNKRTALLSAVIVTFGLGTLYLGLTMKSPRPPNDPYSWDILIFTQSWPKTVCYTWEKNKINHTCHFPSQTNLWTIHGIWPTKLGTIGPAFCNKSLVFDPTKIFGIKEKLNEYWTDIELGSNNFTEANSSISSANTTSHHKTSIYYHEWEKHGTCAVSLPALNSEFKYFFQGIEWSEKYNMKDILEKSGIKTNSTLYVTDLWKAVKSSLKINAWIECFFKKDTEEQLLSEIRICFDKNLNLVDCNGIMKTKRDTSKPNSLTNCNVKKPILYLDYVPALDTSTVLNSTISNSTSDEHSKVLLLRSRRKAVENEWITKNSRHFNRSNSYQPHRNPPIVNHLNRSNSYPYIQRSNWDTITFSQQWPYTFCQTWTANSKTHSCNLPANRNQWTIHGVWPSKIGSFGPSNCKEVPFNIDNLKPIMPELQSHWTDVKKSSTIKQGDFWKHEWNKHGTCALSLPSLNSELKYFKQGLDWSKQYPIGDLLSHGGVLPNSSYPITQFWHTLKTGLGKNPRIDCIMDKTLNKPYINEVRLCFDKTLSLIDCDHFRKNNNRPYTDCPLDQDIYYIGAVA